MKTNKIFKLLVALVLVLCTVLTLTGCKKDADSDAGNTDNTQQPSTETPTAPKNTVLVTVKGQEVLLVVEEKSYTISIKEANFTSESNAEELMKYLDEQCDEFEYVTATGPYGGYIQSMTAIEPADSTQWVALYSSDKQYMDVSAYGTSKTINQVVYYSTGVGISSIKIADGLGLMFELGK